MNRARAAARARGFTMIELMLALGITSILLLGASLVFEVNRESYQRQQGTAGIQNEGRYALELLGRELREAGYRRSMWTAGPVPEALQALDNANGAADGSGPDELVLRYEGIADCVGAAPASGATVVNRYTLAAASLTCNGTAFVRGVEDFQVFFGEDTDGDGVADRVVAPSATGFSARRAVFARIHLLLRSPRTTRKTRTESWFYSAASGGAGAMRTATDGTLRREYTTTVAIRNLL